MVNKINSDFHLDNTAVVDKKETTIANRHRWYSYKESFSKDLVEKAIKDANVQDSDLIIDTFNGGGTVTLTSSLNGYNAIGLEVNPFSAFVSKTKLIDCKKETFIKSKDCLLKDTDFGHKSPLLKFSTFSEKTGKDKWLFNSSVLNTFESFSHSAKFISKSVRPLFQLALIGAAMDNCNAVKDGKCLKYRPNWDLKAYNKRSFIASLESRLANIQEDLKIKVPNKAEIFTCDSRKYLASDKFTPYKLCITSPPYLNSFDYTDIYRPELFLGKFITSPEQLFQLRKRTLRSHVEIKITKATDNNFGIIYSDVIHKFHSLNVHLWDKQLPDMVQAYFEDMKFVLANLSKKADAGGQLWIVVSNSAYNGIEIPVDLILAEIGCQVGWKLKEIGVLRHIHKRVSKNSPEIKYLRESVVIFHK